MLDALAPGDTLRLHPGTYDRGLPVSVSGEPGRCIVIEGIEVSGARPLFTGKQRLQRDRVSRRELGEFVASSGGAISIQPHNDVPKQIDAFLNTILASGTGISITGGDAAFTQRAFANVVFAGQPIRGGDASGNIEGALADAPTVLRAPTGNPGEGLDLRPVDAPAVAGAVDLAGLASFPAADLDFDGNRRGGASLGAYEPGLDGWALALDRR